MKKYIDANILRKEIERRKKLLENGTGHPEVMKRVEGVIKAYNSILTLIDSLQQEQPKLYKDESLGSPDYERGFKHGRDYQTEVTRKYTNKDKVVAYLVDKGYPVSTKGEIPTYQETFDMIKNAIKYANQQEQPKVDLEKEIDKFLNETGAPYIWCNDDEQKEWCSIIARHFWNKGYNARNK